MAHLLLYGGLYILLCRQAEKQILAIFRFRISLAFVITSSIIVAEEVSQLFLESRTFSMMDISMGFLGIGIMAAVQWAIRTYDFERKERS